MIFTVVWVKPARDMLAQIWLDAVDKQAVTAAADRIDRLLRRDPLWLGESRNRDEERVLVEQPLGILFEVDEADRIVHVLVAWRV